MSEILKRHEYSKIFGDMPENEFERFVKDIRENGLIHDIYTHEDKIIDGWHRYKACNLAGIRPRFRPMPSKDPLKFVMSINLFRCHLTGPQQAQALFKIQKHVSPTDDTPADKKFFRGYGNGKYTFRNVREIVNVKEKKETDAEFIKRLQAENKELHQKLRQRELITHQKLSQIESYQNTVSSNGVALEKKLMLFQEEISTLKQLNDDLTTELKKEQELRVRLEMQFQRCQPQI